MGYIDQMSRGMKTKLQKNFAEIRGRMGDPLARKACFWIRPGYKDTVATVRDLAEYFWYSKEYCNKQTKYLSSYESVLADCHWANHHPDWGKYPLYKVTDENQIGLVINVWLYLSKCGAISLPNGVVEGGSDLELASRLRKTLFASI